MGAVIGRGLLAGVIAGIAAGLFYLAVAEPFIEQALTFEQHAAQPEMFSRDVQRIGLLGATTLYGLSVGGLYAVVFLLVGSRLRSGSPWERAVRLAGAIFLAAWFVPFLKYPSNPPAVGDPATVDLRTNLYLAMIVISIVLLVLAYLAARWLEDRRVPASIRLPAVVAGWALAIGLAYRLLPDNPDPVEIPASLIWNMRLASAGGQLLLWSVLGIVFGILLERWMRRMGAAALATLGR
jgi:hypothetical protein